MRWYSKIEVSKINTVCTNLFMVIILFLLTKEPYFLIGFYPIYIYFEPFFLKQKRFFVNKKGQEFKMFICFKQFNVNNFI